MSPLKISPIPAFADNYLWLLERDGLAAIVDPGDAAPVLRVLEERGLRLEAILITHHHADHIDGLGALTARFPEAPVYGPAAEARTIKCLSVELREGDRVSLPGLGVDFSVLEVPGHTLGHIAYVSRAEPGFVLCGDTLFSAGCGRLFEGTAEQMYASLGKLAALPAEMAVYCTHEYTLSNLAFASAVEPGSRLLQEETARVRALRERGEPSLPSSIGRELRINPFLRTAEAAVVEAARRRAPAAGSPGEVFATLRRWKDGFRAT